MKKLLLALFVALIANSSFAATAYFTGRQEMVQTVTYQTGWNCQYRYLNNVFWQVFKGSCPSSIEVN